MKLVYFDEGSAADQLIMNNKGKLEVEGNTKLWGNASVSTEVGFGGFFSSIIKNLPKIKAEWQGEGQVNKVIEKRLTNALLFDYIDALKNAKDIKVFNDVKVRFAPNSLAQIQSLSPYMTMIDGSASIDEGVNIEYSKVDDTLKKGKGYYELLLDEGGSSVVGRFNSLAFRNNYTLGDLIGMNLQIVAIKTGSMTLNQLNIENQFQMTDSEEDTNYFEKYNKNVNFESDSESNRDLDEMDMYDVIVAGVAIL